MATISWLNDQLPQMLWAVLVISVFQREHALAAFRRIAACAVVYRDRKEASPGVSHSELAQIEERTFDCIISIVLKHPLGYAALRPLLLFDKLPGYDRWAKKLSVGPTINDWDTVSDAVLKTLDHQSQESTDCRWLTILFQLAAGKVFFAKHLEEQAKEIQYYPDYGDMRKVRPSIRSMEMIFRNKENGANTWPSDFWDTCFENTPCLRGDIREADKPLPVGTTVQRLREVWVALEQHCYETATTTTVDARHDSIFGFAFYALSILDEVLRIANSQAIAGRLLLRTIVETYITFVYLITNDKDKLWSSYRSYGAGQAKLAFLKLEEAAGDLPTFVDKESLESLANEDVYQEYLLINLGHWDNMNLRKMAEYTGCKDVYDRYYGWTSSYMHGHWGSIRDSVFTTCLNPLHRLHRIPRGKQRTLDDVVPDACMIIDKILDLLDRAYPAFKERVTVKKAV